MRWRTRGLRRGLVGVAIGVGILTTLFSTGASAHAPGWVLSAEGTATVDGLLPETEWPQPAPLSFPVALPPGTGGTTPARLWAMNDETNLYVAVAVETQRSGTGTGRIYTITYLATDASGNTTLASTMVTVPLSQK